MSTKMSYGDLVLSARTRLGMTNWDDAVTATGIKHTRLYQIQNDRGGPGVKWWLLTDFLSIPRTTALNHMKPKQRIKALERLKAAGFPDPYEEEARLTGSTARWPHQDIEVSEADENIPELSHGIDYSGDIAPLEHIKFNKKSMLPIQCCAARAFLGWTQRELAERAKVSPGTIRNFETEVHGLDDTTFKAIYGTFVSNGIVFEADGENGGDGPGARLRQSVFLKKYVD